jgi:cytochrome bd-type quinol oxidase subunit 2
MNTTDICLLAVVALFSIYGLACSVECGISLSLLRNKDHAAKNLFTPLWEVTNVFLVFGLVGVATLFNGALQTISHKLLTTLAVAIFALLLRACVVLTMFYGGQDKLSRFLLWVFALCNFAIPLSLSAASAYLLTGQLFWQTSLGLVVMLIALLGLVSFGLLFVERNGGVRQQAMGRLVFLAWLLSIGSLLPLISQHTVNSLQSGPIASLTLIAGGGLALVLANTLISLKIKVWQLSFVLGFCVPLILAWANRPYFLAGGLTLKQAFGAQAFASTFLIAAAVLLPFLALAGYLFAKLFGDLSKRA